MIIGLDVGGTNIDLVLFKDRQLIKTYKHPLNDNLEEDVIESLNIFLKDIDSNLIRQVNLSTTLTTNLIATSKLKDVGLILQTGPGLPNDYYKTNNYTFFISGYVDHQGVISKDFDRNEINKIKKELLKSNIDDVGIITKFSTRNFIVEENIRKLISNDFRHVNLGHKMSGKLNFKRRVNTTFLNVSVYEEFNLFLNSIKNALKKRFIKAPIYILKACGGTMSFEEAKLRPVESILSGPAASLQGLNANFNIEDDSLLIDIGGTTTDIFVYSGSNYLFESSGAKISSYDTLVRAVYTKSFPLGGDTTIRISKGILKIGPERLDKPYSLGGMYLTLTDAFVYLEEVSIGDEKLATEIISLNAKKFNMTNNEFALFVINEFIEKLIYYLNLVEKEVNNKIVYTIKELLEDKKITPNNIYGVGATYLLLAKYLEKKTNKKIHQAKEGMVANAIGSALSNLTYEITLYIDTSLNTLVIPELGIRDTFNKNIDTDEAIYLAKNYLIKHLNNNVSLEDILVLESEAFNKIEGYRTYKRILVKVGLIPSLKFKLEEIINE